MVTWLCPPPPSLLDGQPLTGGFRTAAPPTPAQSKDVALCEQSQPLPHDQGKSQNVPYK